MVFLLPLMSSIHYSNSKRHHLSLEELHTLLISEKSTIEKSFATEASPTAFNVAAQNFHGSRGRGRKNNPNFYSPNKPQFRGNPTYSSGSHGANFSQPKSPFYHSQPNNIFSPNSRPIHFSPANNFSSGHSHHNGLIGPGPTYRPIFNHENNFGARHIFCQICQKQGHGALDCYNRMNFSYQGRHPPSGLAAMAVNYMNSRSSDNTNNFWLSYSGCNVHMTNMSWQISTYSTIITVRKLSQWKMTNL